MLQNQPDQPGSRWCGLDDAVHADTALSQNSLQVLHNLLSLLLNGGTLDLAGLRVQRNLTRSKDKLLGLDGLRVGADRSRCVRRRNNILFHNEQVPFLDLRVQRNLTRSKDKLLGLDGLRVGADRSRCVRRRNNILFHNEQVPFLDYLTHKWSDLFALMMIPEMCSFFKLNLRTI